MGGRGEPWELERERDGGGLLESPESGGNFTDGREVRGAAPPRKARPPRGWCRDIRVNVQTARTPQHKVLHSPFCLQKCILIIQSVMTTGTITEVHSVDETLSHWLGSIHSRTLSCVS